MIYTQQNDNMEVAQALVDKQLSLQNINKDLERLRDEKLTTDKAISDIKREQQKKYVYHI